MSEPTPTSRNAMNLRSFQITNYRNIINSGTIDVTRMAVLVGQNECGKSNLLSALKCINPFDESSYNIDEDWPIDNWPPPSKSPVVSTAHFDLEPDDIAALFEGASPAPSDAAIAHVPPTKLRIMVT